LAVLSTLPHHFKYLIAGNHDFGLCTRDGWFDTRGKELHQMYNFNQETDPEAIKKAIRDWESKATSKSSPDGNRVVVQKYLEDEKAQFEVGGKTWSIYGSPVSSTL